MIKVSAPGKIHLLGEHTVVYGKPALLTTIDLRVTISIRHPRGGHRFAPQENINNITKIIEPIVKKELKIKTIPPYELTITSDIPVGAGLGSSAAVSAAYVGALLLFLKVDWDLNFINKLTFEAEKVFHGKPSGGDNSTVVYGGLVWFRKETHDLKIIQPLNIKITRSSNFVLINTGRPKETTKEMVELVKPQVKNILDDQERLVKELVSVLKEGNEKEFIRIIREGEKNLESIGAVSPYVKSIIRQIEKSCGAGKICGGGGQTRATGILLTYHKDRKVLEKIAKSFNLPFFRVALGVEGLRNES